jgi:hypothetical protein
MTNTIFNVLDQLRTALLTFSIPIYKEVKKDSETGKCFVLTYIPIKKTYISSTNDIVILLYLPKIAGIADMISVETYSNSIETKLKAFKAANGQINFNENVDPFTDNLDSNYTVTTFKIRTINY